MAMSDPFSDLLFTFTFALMLGQMYFIHTRDSLPRAYSGAVWVTAIIATVHAIATSTDPGIQWSGVFMLTFILTLAIQMGRTRGPGAPDGYHGHPR